MTRFIKIGVPILLALGALLLLYGVGVSVYSAGKQAGKDQVTKDWNQEKLDYQNEILRLKAVHAGLEKDFEDRANKTNRDLRNAKVSYEKTLANHASEYAARVRNHQERADLYERKAQGSEVERRGLASHAAELDRSLEEGRRVVKDLRTTVEQRDTELILLGTHLKTFEAYYAN